MRRPSRKPPTPSPTALPGHAPAAAMPSRRATLQAVLEATVSVRWERPVHEARLAFLRRMAQPGEVSVHVACGSDRLGFLDVAYGLTTILTDVESASLNALAQQFAAFAAQCGPLLGRLQCRQLSAEELTSVGGFAPRSIHHLTLLNLFNANLYPASDYPRLIDPLLTIIAPGGSFFLTASEADVLLSLARARQIGLNRLGDLPGYYDEDIVLLQVHRTSA